MFSFSSGSGRLMSLRGSHSVKCSYPPRMGQIGHEVGVRMAYGQRPSWLLKVVSEPALSTAS